MMRKICTDSERLAQAAANLQLELEVSAIEKVVHCFFIAWHREIRLQSQQFYC